MPLGRYILVLIALQLKVGTKHKCNFKGRRRITLKRLLPNLNFFHRGTLSRCLGICFLLPLLTILGRHQSP